MTIGSKILMGSGAGGDPVDDEFDNVSFLSHFDGANNGTNIVYDDASPSNHTISVTGTPPQGTFGPFARPEGEWSNYFTGGTNGSRFSFPADADTTLGTGNFTIEFWMRLDAMSALDLGNNWFTFFTTGAGEERIIIYENGGQIWCMFKDSTPSLVCPILKTPSSGITSGAWHHVAIVRNGTTFTAYADGIGGTTQSGSGSIAAATVAPLIGNSAQGSYNSYGFKGYLSNFRLVKGTAVYTSNFTPPTSALTAISGTVLLTCRSNRFVDKSTSGHVLTAAGASPPQASAFTPFLTSEVYDSAVNGASAYFDGTTDYLSAADSADLTPGDTFTLEAWVFPTTLNAYNTLMSQNSSTGYYWSILANGTLQFYTGAGGGGGGEHNSASGVVKLNQWNHVAYSVSSGTGYHFVNGVRSGSSGTNDIPNIAANLHIADQGGWPFTGYGADYRLVVGTALYTGTTYTVPTAPLASTGADTKLLLNMADGQALDSAAQNNMMLYGNADISTTQYKFGTSSLALGGSDFAQIQQAKNISGPFTIECWARADDTGKAYMWSQGQYAIELNLDSTELALYLHSASSWTVFFGSGEFTANTWHHVAVVRDTSNVIKVYLNGTASSTTVTDSASYPATSNVFFIGGEWASASTANYTWDGYIDDFRISKFARYTSNFTPATKAFPDKGQ